MSHHASVHIDAATEVKFHCDQEQGASWMLGGYDSLTVYLSGTADELRAFAARCREAADEFERTRAEADSDDDVVVAF